MQSYFAPPGSPIYAGNAASLAELEAKPSRTFDRGTSGHDPAVSKKTLRERLRRPLLILFPILLAAFGAAYYLAAEPYVATDDAFVRAAKQSINARVAGQAVEIAVVDNQRVQRGQLLFRIDPEPYRLPSIRLRRGSAARVCRSTR
jgi:membrane fusion protein (multidrug efflux system)